ncbi:hypothetical protein M422DRAFT_251131 [Sphaerobolus stellatus SS14]|uniref:Uncharacterized protein n=1 Tax=Sphaerobolus stellatus (strain SS14) TaxID=990650 RepID=A0A0C9UR34_SPHS4|nr:hypothetical protein M422DRAFT_251131 [Sphaerobolus stellatus SS14]
MDNEHNAPMQTNTMSALQAFKLDPSTEWVIKPIPGFVAIKHKMGCSICDASASHCMAAKRSYEIHLSEKDVSHTVAEACPELVRYQDDYYHLLEDHNALKEKVQSAEKKAEDHRAKMNELYEKLDSQIKSNSDELPKNEEFILKNKHLQQELDYYVGRAQYALYGKDANWATCNGYRVSDIPMSDGEDNDEDLGGLPTMPEEIPQDAPSHPPAKLAHPVGKSHQNNSKVIHKAGIPAIGGSCLPPAPKRIIADPPTSITGVLPRPLGKSRAEHWDQPTLQGASDWVMESDIHDSEMRRLYVKGRALQPHQPHLWSPDHTAVIFHIDEYTRLLPGLPRNLMVRHDDPDWMINVIQAFNANPSGIPRSQSSVAEADVLLQSIFSTVGKWDQMIAGQWKRNDSLFLCSPTPASYQINHNQKFDRRAFTYWLGCHTGTIWNEVTLRSQLQANEIASLKGNPMNQFRVQDDLLPLVQESPYYVPPSVGEPMDQDETDPEPNLIQHTAGSSSLADSYYDSLVPQGTACESTAEITEALTHDLYADNLE